MLTYAQAKMIIWNAEAYSRADVRKACIYILGTMKAAAEDVSQAMMLI